MKAVSPKQQAKGLLTGTEWYVLREYLDVLTPQAQEDLCFAIVAYKRFRVYRTFSNNLLQVIFTSFVKLFQKHQSL